MSAGGLFLVFVMGLAGVLLAWSLSRGGRLPGGGDTLFDDGRDPVWVERDGAVLWANGACTDHFGPDFTGRAGLETRQLSHGSEVQIVSTARSGDDCHFRIAHHWRGPFQICAAQDAGALVEIEGELSRFIQTLTTTFAHLPIGLAVFDRKRDLTLFNPALSDLLGVTPHWLASRPTMAEFLDRLRADGSMPEPRDYGQLRQEFEELKSGSFTGHYEVEWTLPSGRLYRVSGRPHAAGGAALLFEDITRYARIETHYQAEMRQLHGALEVMTGGVAIFDAAGELAYANDAFDDLLGQQFSMAVTPVSIVDVTRQAQRLCRPTPVLGDLRDFMLDLQGRSAWSADLTLVSGETIALQVTPISDGRAVVELRRQEPRSVGTAGRLAATG